jgi:protocatechuate 3,4-dioxygenase beta subunit/thiol-disulfide isomerase/thioredoxin
METRLMPGKLLLLLTLALFPLPMGSLPLPAAEDDTSARATIVGAVVDEAGKPIAGAKVWAPDWGKRQPATTATTDTEGRFRVSIPRLSGGQVFATLLAEGSDGRLGLQHIGGAKLEPVRIVLRPSRGLSVRVRDRDGRPVPGAEVGVFSSFRRVAGGRSNAQGRWTGRVPSDLAGWGVNVLKGGVGFDYAVGERARGSLEQPRPLPDELAFTLDGARSLRVKTVDQDGKPIAGVKVGPWFIHKPGREEDSNPAPTVDSWPSSGPDGSAVIDWLPRDFVGMIGISVSSDDFYPPNHATWIAADKPVTELKLTLYPLERLSGRVTRADGRPAEGVLVVVEGNGAGDAVFHGAVRTGADGRYSLKVNSEQAYIITASKDDQAAAYRAGLVVRAGRPVEGVDLVLGPATRVRGRVTVGKEGRPVADTSISVVIDKGQIPEELRRKDDPYYRSVSMDVWGQTDKDGLYEFLLGPGEYEIRGPARTEPVKLKIPANNLPVEIVRDFRMPRPEAGPLSIQVVDAQGRPVAGAIVNGGYTASQATRWFHEQRTDAQGRLRTERSLDPLVLHARTADGKLAGVARIDAEAAEARIVIGPVSTATGRLMDTEGKALAQRELAYGIRIYYGEPGISAFSRNFGGNITTDAQGRFRLSGLVPGETYDVDLKLDERRSKAVIEVSPTGTGMMELADVRVDLSEPRPYVPPTPRQRAADAFAASKKTSPRGRMDQVLEEARREYTRSLLLFGRPDDPACIDLFRLFHEEPAQADQAAPDKGVVKRLPSASELRWEFELAALDAALPEVRQLAGTLGIDTSPGRPPALAVLDAAGSAAATHPLRLDASGKLGHAALSKFLADHKLPTRDAERLLAETLAKGKAEDKRVFLILSASWCGPCRLLARFLASQKRELEPHFVFVKLDISRDEHVDSIFERFQGSRDGGIPWYAILDADGKALVASNREGRNSRAGSRNIGFPSDRASIDHFMSMLRQTAPRLSEQTLGALRQALSKRG